MKAEGGEETRISRRREVTTRVSGSRNGDEFAKEGGREGEGKVTEFYVSIVFPRSCANPGGHWTANTTGLDSVLLGLENFFTTLEDGVNRPYFMI